MSLIVIKLGGSVITYKDSKTPKPRKKIIAQLAEEISDLYQKGYQIILVHGGGSYGHNLAKKYNLTSGLKTKESLIGLAKTVQSMNKLNLIIVDLLEKAGLPIVTFSPHSFITQTSGKLNDFDTSVIENVLARNFIPVLYGDGVVDLKIGCGILSGDTIATYLSRKLNADQIIFLSDVDGIFEDNPFNNPNAKMIKEVNNHNLSIILNKINSNSNDVTGGMKGKILSIKENLNKQNVYIINGLKKGNLSIVLSDKTIGTTLYFE